MAPIIEVSKVWKRYRIHEFASIYRRAFNLKRMGRDLLKFIFNRDSKDDFWALRDISFELEPGQCLGVIGPNGAGKTTLLRLLSGITRPTRGHIKVKGRIGALISIGAGFHGELTGRENIYLNGAIMGMSRREIDRKFDSIVDFSEIEQFLETPLKRYSSGMAVRLGFSVAVHMEPEVLLVDEVLAVGDIAFKQKCLQRIEELFDSGITVVFVSHNIMAVNRICQRAILLDKGAIVQDGPVGEVVPEYFKQVIEHKLRLTGWKREKAHMTEREKTAPIVPLEAHLFDADGNETDQIQQGGTIRLRIEFNVQREIKDAQFLAGIHTPENVHVIVAKTGLNGKNPSFQKGRAYIECTFKDLKLLPGVYGVWVSALGTGNLLRRVQNLINFSVVPRPHVEGLVLDCGLGYIEADADWEWSKL